MDREKSSLKSGVTLAFGSLSIVAVTVWIFNTAASMFNVLRIPQQFGVLLDLVQVSSLLVCPGLLVILWTGVGKRLGKQGQPASSVVVSLGIGLLAFLLFFMAIRLTTYGDSLGPEILGYIATVVGAFGMTLVVTTAYSVARRGGKRGG